jgi:hypothetical protein
LQLKKERDDILTTSELYKDETLQSLGIGHLHDICHEAINRCKKFIKPLGLRFSNLKSQSPLLAKEEVKWLTEALDTWFTKKWNDRRSVARKNESAKSLIKKRTQVCAQCQKVLHCPECDGVSAEVLSRSISHHLIRKIQNLNIQDLPKNQSASIQTERRVDDKTVQTGADLGMKANSLCLDDDDDLSDDHGAISEDEDTEPEPSVPDADKFFFGTGFEKLEEFDHHLDEPNPWHDDLNKPLFPSQIIGFRWMASRHSKGGGLVGDKVGCGKV